MSFHTKKSPTNALPTMGFSDDPDTGFHSSAANVIDLVAGGVDVAQFGTAGTTFYNAPTFGSQLQQGQQGVAFTITKRVTAILDSTAKTILTVTIPNTAQSAFFTVYLVARAGAGGAIGANEAVSASSYNVAVTRTPGLATVVNVSAQLGVATNHVVGSDTITATLAAAAVAGGNTITQTIPLQITVTMGSGTATNHVCAVIVQGINDNSSGITIA